MSDISTAPDKSTARMLAPIVVLGATWAARKGMNKGYEAATGHVAPRAAEREPSLVSKVLWAAAMAGVVVLVESLIWSAIDAFDGELAEDDFVEGALQE